jgi:hypothetical protein
LYGAAGPGSTVWVDVASGTGSVHWARFPISPASGETHRIIAHGDLTLPESVEDLEVRVHVGSQDVLSIEGYDLILKQ